MTGAFITAIGTDCGKTHVGCAIVRAMRDKGRPPLALKPLMSGHSPSSLEHSDAGRLLTAMGRNVDEQSVAEICWKAFAEPLAPNLAARRAGLALDYGEMLAFVQTRIAAHDGAVLVEGAGGVMSPLTDTATNLDFAVDLGMPVVLLASNYLGAVSHTLTALEVLRSRKRAPTAIVVTDPHPEAAPALMLIEELRRWTRIRLLHAPYRPDDDAAPPYAQEIAQRLFG